VYASLAVRVTSSVKLEALMWIMNSASVILRRRARVVVGYDSGTSMRFCKIVAADAYIFFRAVLIPK